MMAANDLAVRRALEGAGVEFIDENACGVFQFHVLDDDYYL